MLEQVDYLFHNGVPLRKFGTTDVPTFEQREVNEKGYSVEDEVVVPSKAAV